jgi:hypothetical protein
MNIYSDRTPYTYLIGWSKLDKWYYGVRFAKKCNPSDLWTKYFTSSKYIKTMREQEGEPDIIEIRKIFSSHHDAIKWEEKVLRRLNVLNDDKWINRNVAGAIAPMPGELNPRYGKGKSIEEIEKWRKSIKKRTSPRKGHKHSEKFKAEQGPRTTAIHTGRKWYTNGVVNRKLKPSDLIPHGFTAGRTLNFCNSTLHSERYWCNDGIKNKKIKKTEPMPEGFKAGVIKKSSQLKWYTDGTISKMFCSSETIPVGFWPGRKIE